ncbi:MAG: DoxX-like family protein [Candidatus Saccharibacteria bacterium]|nr:DoxX-like family protein [Moraxellaceae bacterium]
MKNTKQLLYQIRGLARSVIAFVFLYQGIVPKILFAVSPEYSNLSEDSFLLNYPWLTYLGGLFEIGIAIWLIIAFTDKKPLFASIGVLVFSLFSTLIFSSHDFATRLNIVTITAALLALIFIDLNILKFQKDLIGQKKIGQYIRVTRNRMIYQFIKRLETKDLPHLMHTLAQSRVKRHLKNRRLSKRRSELTETTPLAPKQSTILINERSLDDRRKSPTDDVNLIDDDFEKLE